MKAVILILVLILIGFAAGAWASFSQPRQKAPSDPRKEAQSHHPSGWEKGLGWLFQPGGQPNPLKKSVYHAADPYEVIGKSDKTRQVKLRMTHRELCTIRVEYRDNAPPEKNAVEQKTDLPWSDKDKEDPQFETTLVLTRTGGTLHFGACSQQNKNGCPARIEVVK